MSPTIIAILYVSGAALLLIELLTPGLVIGAVGLACLGTAIYYTFALSALFGAVALAACTAFSAAVVLFAVRRLTVRGALTNDAGYVSFDTSLAKLQGAEGEALTVLRPSGFCRLDGRRIAVVTRGEHIEPGAKIRVIDVEGGRVVVRAA